MKYKAVIFDLDGTLIDTAYDIGFYINMILQRHSFAPVDMERVPSIVGNGLKNAMSQALAGKETDDSKIDFYTKELITEYGKKPVIKSYVYPGIDALLKEVKKMGMKIAVFSNKTHSVTAVVVDTLFSKGVFDVVLGSKEDIPRKPNPDGALRIVKELGVAVRETLYFGDSDVDCITAKNGGFDFVAALWGFRSEAQLCAAGALNYIKKPDEFLQFLK